MGKTNRILCTNSSGPFTNLIENSVIEVSMSFSMKFSFRNFFPKLQKNNFSKLKLLSLKFHRNIRSWTRKWKRRWSTIVNGPLTLWAFVFYRDFWILKFCCLPFYFLFGVIPWSLREWQLSSSFFFHFSHFHPSIHLSLTGEFSRHMWLARIMMMRNLLWGKKSRQPSKQQQQVLLWHFSFYWQLKCWSCKALSPLCQLHSSTACLSTVSCLL